MPAKKPYKVDIDVIPYLSIMAIVLKLICLILIVMVMRIAVNPDALKVCRYPSLYQPPEEAAPPKMMTVTNKDGTTARRLVAAEKQISKTPVYFDCHPDRLEIQPENVIIPISELRERGGDFEITMSDLAANSTKKLAVVITRPNSTPVYRYLRRQIAASKVTVGYDVLESDVIIAWTNEIKRLDIKLDVLNARRQAEKYDIPLETMTNWVAQALKEKIALTSIIERVKSGKRFDETPRKAYVAPAHH